MDHVKRVDRDLDDIRGVVGDTLDPGVAELIGQAIGTVMHEKELQDIVVGRDGRLSGPDMVAGLVAGLRKAGRNVIDIGLAPTPLVYFGSYHLRTGCCVAVTGSHNPPDYNGFKMMLGKKPFYGQQIQEIGRMAREGDVVPVSTEGHDQLPALFIRSAISHRLKAASKKVGTSR